jgi:hypothetical protein
VKVRIVKQPTRAVEGIGAGQLRLGRVYDVTASLANYLVAEGFAIFERREQPEKPSSFERRRKPY